MLEPNLHQHPELPTKESQTAAFVARHLVSLEYEVQTNVGGHGVIGILKNGHGKVVLLRSELDALPMQEMTGLAYASRVQQVDADGVNKWVTHGCGHDMHIASLLGAAELLRRTRQHWCGTIICLFQPNEERLLGAQAMIDDGLFDKIPLPDIILGQHIVPTKAGTIGTRAGRVLGYVDSLRVRVYGLGTHSSTPELGVDPILMASSIISRLQMIVAREIDPKQSCVVACGMLHAGTDASIIPEFADFSVDVRSFDSKLQERAVQAVKRIIVAECQAASSPRPPMITTAASCPPIDNDVDSNTRLTEALITFFGDDAGDVVIPMDLDMTADDFVLLGYPPGRDPIPYVYWNFGATPKEEYERAERNGSSSELPCNHNPRFAPEVEPSLRAGILGLAIAAVTFL